MEQPPLCRVTWKEPRPRPLKIQFPDHNSTRTTLLEMPEKIIKKRKRESKNVGEDAGAGLDAMEIFKRHFESQFAPLKETGVKKKAKKTKKAEAEDEWEGLSDGEGSADTGNGSDALRNPVMSEYN